MEGMKDWNEMNIEEYISHLENKFLVDSSGTAKAVFELIRAYRALNLPVVGVRSEQLAKSEYCNKCGDYVGSGCDNIECKDFKG